MKPPRRLRLTGIISAAFATVAVGGAATAVDTDPQPPMSMDLALEITHSTRPLTVEEIDRYEEAIAFRWGAARPDQVAEKLKGTLDTLGRDGGATWVSEEETLNIYVSGPTVGKDAAIDKAQALATDVIRGSNVKVQIHAGGLRSEAQLVSTMDAVSDTKSYDTTGTVKVRSQVINYKTGRVAVDVTSQTAADIVKKKFGDAVEVQVKAPYTQEELDDMFQVENRRSDSPSNGWNGGTAMCSSNVGDCTPGAAAGDSATCTTGRDPAPGP